MAGQMIALTKGTIINSLLIRFFAPTLFPCTAQPPTERLLDCSHEPEGGPLCGVPAFTRLEAGGFFITHDLQFNGLVKNDAYRSYAVA